MNEIFLIGKVVTDIDFKFIINSKNISIATFKIETIDNQLVSLMAYSDNADYAYSKLKINDYIGIYGHLETNGLVNIENIMKQAKKH